MKKAQSIILVLLLTGYAIAGTRVAYTRPGPMMKIPYSTVMRSENLFTAGFGTEIHNFTNLNMAKGVYFDAELGRSFLLGFSSVQGADTTALSRIGTVPFTAPVEFGFHMQFKLYSYEDISISAGLQDIIFQNSGNDSGLQLDPDKLSFFGIISSEKNIGSYRMSTYMGFGTGSLATIDTVETDTATGTRTGVFAGFVLNTPYLGRGGGLDLVGEFDGTGINVGLRIPLTSDYRLNLGFTHIEKLPDWDTPYWAGHPGVTVGLEMSVPRARQKTPPTVTETGAPVTINGKLKLPGTDPYESLSGQVDSTLALADAAVLTLRDSMALVQNEMRNLMVRLSAMEQRGLHLEDSLKSLKLSSNVIEKNMNEALRHLSRSLRYFYAGDYREALQEVETALELNPNLALAYARRGSIYYKLGDVQRATINWNLALRMDPEYEDVRNILKALHENRLKSTSIIDE
ncbi:MAG: tetratricopeptide repeat protein [Candidatus Neomarinimicrobiota bacterium]